MVQSHFVEWSPMMGGNFPRVLAFLVLSLLIPFPASSRMVNYSFDGVVTEVMDGDTFLLETIRPYTPAKFWVRLYGVFAPVLAHNGKPGQPYAVKAKAALEEQLNGQKVRVEVREVDPNERQVGLVYLRSRNINEDMLREGWGWYWRTPEYRFIQFDDDDRLYRAEEEARDNRRGLWRETNPQPPWEFRNPQNERAIHGR
jgi:endonuclease YncB( thermonuclease family)